MRVSALALPGHPHIIASDRLRRELETPEAPHGPLLRCTACPVHARDRGGRASGAEGWRGGGGVQEGSKAGSVAVAPGSSDAEGLLRKVCLHGVVLMGERPVKLDELESEDSSEGGAAGAEEEEEKAAPLVWGTGTEEQQDEQLKECGKAIEGVSRCTRVSEFSVVRSILDEPPEPGPAPKGWQVEPEGGGVRLRVWHRANPAAQLFLCKVISPWSWCWKASERPPRQTWVGSRDKSRDAESMLCSQNTSLLRGLGFKFGFTFSRCGVWSVRVISAGASSLERGF